MRRRSRSRGSKRIKGSKGATRANKQKVIMSQMQEKEMKSKT